MVRYDYYDLIKTENDVRLYDLTKLNWNNFSFSRNAKQYILTQRDIDKFYYVTEEYYGDLFNEDLIYFINKISDPMELKVGQEILLPDRQDIIDFINSELRIKF